MVEGYQIETTDCNELSMRNTCSTVRYTPDENGAIGYTQLGGLLKSTINWYSIDTVENQLEIIF